MKCSVAWCTTRAQRRAAFYAKKGDFDECQIDRSGRWLVIKENVDGRDGEDNRIIDLQTGVERLLLDSNGAAGHSDVGFGSMIAEDNFNSLAGRRAQVGLFNGRHRRTAGDGAGAGRARVSALVMDVGDRPHRLRERAAVERVLPIRGPASATRIERIFLESTRLSASSWMAPSRRSSSRRTSPT